MSDLINIVVNGSPVSLEDWSSAKRANVQELPALSEMQREAARKLQVSADDYARSLLAQQYGADRVRTRAEKFASRLNRLLLEKNIVGQVVKLERRPGALAWVVDIGVRTGAGSLQVPFELFDDVVDDAGNNSNYTDWLQAKLSSLVQRSLNLGDVA